MEPAPKESNPDNEAPAVHRDVVPLQNASIAKENGESGNPDAEAPSAPLQSASVAKDDDEAGRPEVTVRPLDYAWEQTDEEVKIYISFDQSDELRKGVPEERVSVEFGDWNLLVVIQSPVEGRPPLGLRLGDFVRRVEPDRCKHIVRSSRITLKLRKREKEHWFNLLQKGRRA
mmetsp:Transcript_20564/g.57122  ORF Transcript_20564/g.57122 Transcript_20564/m.57122 type:complete len:173 (-) Transcript_20564:133-651(-)|eukprot:CAMPEP_0117535248 /NCGR_PEP_ID=MMETSP0784-20121206/40836_1 /TAXON_ID=39447 /ORGANISM="" /LENGTH=172 /DNA_ID=CAMNT_0005331767 /DNA_START=96 /DNA_END=614 /DNA_ORIENTATION=-